MPQNVSYDLDDKWAVIRRSIKSLTISIDHKLEKDLNMLDDLMTTIKAQLYERATSPLIASFCISWLLINWKFIFTLLSDGSRIEKLSYIETILYPTQIDYLTSWALCPLLSATAITFALPWPSRLFDAFARMLNM